jgi:hypothetical protein
LVGCEESHELWHLDDLDISTLVYVEVGPGLVEVGIEIGSEGSAGETLMGVEDLLGSGEGGGLGHPEFSGWLTTDLGSIIEGLGVGSLLNGVLLDHGSHEDVVRISREVRGNNSLVLAVGGTVLNGLPGVVWWGGFWLLNGNSETEKGSNGEEFHKYALAPLLRRG